MLHLILRCLKPFSAAKAMVTNHDTSLRKIIEMYLFDGPTINYQLTVLTKISTWPSHIPAFWSSVEANGDEAYESVTPVCGQWMMLSHCHPRVPRDLRPCRSTHVEQCRLVESSSLGGLDTQMRLTTSSSVKTRRILWSLTMGNLFVEDDDDNDVLDNTDE